MAAMPWEGKICIPRTTYVSMKKNQLLYNQFYTSLILMHFDASAKKSWQQGTWFMDEFISWFVMGCNYVLGIIGM